MSTTTPKKATASRPYIIREGEKDVGLVNAISEAQALRHFYRAKASARVATAMEAAKLGKSGMEIEDATVEQEPST